MRIIQILLVEFYVSIQASTPAGMFCTPLRPRRAVFYGVYASVEWALSVDILHAACDDSTFYA